MSKYFKLLLLGLLTSPVVLHAQLVYTFDNLNQTIPDGDPSGLVNVQDISDGTGMIVTDVNVTLSISGTGLGGFNGDLYVTLQHDNGYAVLLNRVGARTGATYGYSDSGLNVTFDENAGQGDIHAYRLVLNGNHTTPLGGPLTGTWQSDARISDPSTVLATDAQTATLASFNGTTVNGKWSLFVTDVSSGASHQLNGWSMELTAVPEPATYGVLAGLGLLAFAVARKQRSPSFKACANCSQANRLPSIP